MIFGMIPNAIFLQGFNKKMEGLNPVVTGCYVWIKEYAKRRGSKLLEGRSVEFYERGVSCEIKVISKK